VRASPLALVSFATGMTWLKEYFSASIVNIARRRHNFMIVPVMAYYIASTL
jgi:hypothetical protein